MTWLEAKDAVLAFLGSGAVVFFAYELRRLRESVESLNILVGKVVAQQEYQEEKLKEHHGRLRHLETRRHP